MPSSDSPREPVLRPVSREHIPASPLRCEVYWDLPWPDPSKPARGYTILEDVEHCEIYHGNPEQGVYSHGAQIAFHAGTLYAAWNNHLTKDEDAPGQRVLGAVSKDGRGWGECFEVFPPLDKVQTQESRGAGDWRALWGNAWVTLDDAIYAIGHVFGKAGKYPDVERMGYLGHIAREIRPDGAGGAIFWLVDNPPEPIPGLQQFPDLTNSAFTKIALRLIRRLADPLRPHPFVLGGDASLSYGLDGQRLTEPSVYRRPDGVLVKIWRDLRRGSVKRLYASVSTQPGHWWPPLQTNIPSQPSRVTTGTLPSGDIYLIGNLAPRRDNALRDPLVIALSRDGIHFDWARSIRHDAPRPRHSTRPPSFAYPAAVVAHEHLWVIYSVGKEDVAVSRIPRSALGT